MKAKQTPKAGERTQTITHPEYSENGPVWTVCPMETYVECEVGTVIVFLVVDLDYDTKNFCGNCIAECGSYTDAVDIVRALNTAPMLLAALEQFIDEPLACASYKSEAAATGIRANCDCWACTKTRIARAAVNKAKGVK